MLTERCKTILEKYHEVYAIVKPTIMYNEYMLTKRV